MNQTRARITAITELVENMECEPESMQTKARRTVIQITRRETKSPEENVSTTVCYPAYIRPGK